MSYDLNGAWNNVTGHNSPLFPSRDETGEQRQLNMVCMYKVDLEYRQTYNIGHNLVRK